MTGAQPEPACGTGRRPAVEGAAPTWSYVLPMAIFVAVGLLEAPLRAHYAAVYSAKIAVVGLTLWFCRGTLTDFKPRRGTVAGLLVGALVAVTWIPIDRLTPYHLSMFARVGIDPLSHMGPGLPRLTFLATRLLGLIFLTPVIEELFWRSLLLRSLSSPDGNPARVRVGYFTWPAFWWVAGLFALSHPEWLSAVTCAVLYGLLLWRTRSLYSVLVAHVASNLGLAIIILHTHAWNYW